MWKPLFGKDNPSWKGDKAGYKALHLRVRTKRGIPKKCSQCRSSDRRKRYEWANLSGNYKDVKDYSEMCVQCHRKYDSHKLPRKLDSKLKMDMAMEHIENKTTYLDLSTKYGVSISLVSKVCQSIRRSKMGNKYKPVMYSKLSEDQVMEIKGLLSNGYRVGEISRDFNVSQALISSIKSGKVWGNVQE